jgi:type II secretory pathway component PulK
MKLRVRLFDQYSGAGARRGVVLFAVLIVVAILMLVGYQFLNLMQVEFEAALASNKVAQARRLADSGLHYAAYLLAYPASAGLNNDGSRVVAPYLVYDNPNLFHQRPVTDSTGNIVGYFSLVSPRDPSDPLAAVQGFRFGVEDEGGKINLNSCLKIDKTGAVAKEVLSAIPNMTPDMASSLLNWMRSPNAQDSSGDSLYYASLGYS